MVQNGCSVPPAAFPNPDRDTLTGPAGHWKALSGDPYIQRYAAASVLRKQILDYLMKKSR